MRLREGMSLVTSARFFAEWNGRGRGGGQGDRQPAKRSKKRVGHDGSIRMIEQCDVDPLLRIVLFRQNTTERVSLRRQYLSGVSQVVQRIPDD